MTLEEYNNIVDEERLALITAGETATQNVADLTAERDSLQEELTGLQTQVQTLTDELNNTKKLNFTLARQVNTATPEPSPEEILFNLFGGGKRNG